MRVLILQKVQKGNEYAYHPGDLIIDHPDEQAWIAAGAARPQPEEPEAAVPPAAESAVTGSARPRGRRNR